MDLPASRSEEVAMPMLRSIGVPSSNLAGTAASSRETVGVVLCRGTSLDGIPLMGGKDGGVKLI